MSRQSWSPSHSQSLDTQRPSPHRCSRARSHTVSTQLAKVSTQLATEGQNNTNRLQSGHNVHRDVWRRLSISDWGRLILNMRSVCHTALKAPLHSCFSTFKATETDCLIWSSKRLLLVTKSEERWLKREADRGLRAAEGPDKTNEDGFELHHAKLL